MKICIAQTISEKGEVSKNIKNHITLIENAIDAAADLIVFPELSITGYVPTLATLLATTKDDTPFDHFQEKSNQNNITIGIGVPLISNNGITISMLFFQPNKERLIYSKQLLHTDELPYFVKGNEYLNLSIKNKTIAFGICYETLQTSHFKNSVNDKTDVYIASVAKSQNGIDKAQLHFPKMAKEYSIPILLSNAIGLCDNFIAVGQSAVWDKNGALVEQIDTKNQGIIIFEIDPI